MSFVIYDTGTTVIFEHPKTRKQYYNTMGAAKAAKTRARRAGLLKETDYSISDAGFFKSNIEKTHMVRNIMSGVMVEESVNTPYSCSVASEAYFSM